MRTLNQFFEAYSEKYASNIMMYEKSGNTWTSSTYSEIRQKVHYFAAGLITLGLKKGERVSLISEGRNAWVISELGILYNGAVNVPLSVKLLESSDLSFRINHSGSKMVIISGGQMRKLQEIKKELTGVEKFICLDKIESNDEKDIFFDDVLNAGKEWLKSNGNEFSRVWQAIQPDDPANICYTSGTTADPKGIMLSHRNYTANVEQGLSLMTIPEYYCTLLILPWDHSFAHTAGIYAIIASGASMASIQTGANAMETLKNIPINIKEIKPHFLLSVPTLAKNFKKNIEKGVQDKGVIAKTLFRTGLGIAITYNGLGYDKGKGWRKILKPMYGFFDRILFSKVRLGLGGRLDFFVGGGALLDIDLQKFFYAIGMPMYQGYGLTEASPIISSNAAHKHKLGSSGVIAKNLELKICDDKGNALPTGEKGEIVIRGENVMLGYWNNERATKEALREGWLYTGDLGYLDKHGFLYVLGRFKSLLISDDGEKYSPEGIEEALQSSPYIDKVMLYNNQRSYTTALIYPVKESLRRKVKEHGDDPDSDKGCATALRIIESEINEYRNGRHANMFPSRWLPAAVGILSEDFTEQNRMMNSTMKIVRPRITEVYKDLLEFVYTPEAKVIANKRNIEAMRKLIGA